MEKVESGDQPWHMVAKTSPTFIADVDYCDFPMGYATCPPPDMNMDKFMESIERDTGDFDFYVHVNVREI